MGVNKMHTHRLYCAATSHGDLIDRATRSTSAHAGKTHHDVQADQSKAFVRWAPPCRFIRGNVLVDDQLAPPAHALRLVGLE
jgi:hypothetical protein